MYQRPCDSGIYRMVYLENEYRLPPALTGRILDIGGHIGCFAVMCAERGAEQVVSYEPGFDSYQYLVANSKGFPIFPIHAAVWTQGDVTAKLYPSGEPASWSLYYGKEGDPFESVIVVNIYDALNLAKPHTVKIDCEGSEFAIIGATDFPGVERIYAEFHFDEEKMKESIKKLEEINFKTVRHEKLQTLIPVHGDLWLYEGTR